MPMTKSTAGAHSAAMSAVASGTAMSRPTPMMIRPV